MDKAELIRHEIEKRRVHNLAIGNPFFLAMAEEDIELLCFIDSMQEEPVNESTNIELMIESYKQRLISQANGVKNSPLIDMCLTSYKHGINETLDTLNLSNVQRTVKNQKESVSEELKDAAWLYYDNNRLSIPPEWDLHKEFIDFFKAGAQWQKSKDESPTEDLEEVSKKYFNIEQVI